MNLSYKKKLKPGIVIVVLAILGGMIATQVSANLNKKSLGKFYDPGLCLSADGCPTQTTIYQSGFPLTFKNYSEFVSVAKQDSDAVYDPFNDTLNRVTKEEYDSSRRILNIVAYSVSLITILTVLYKLSQRKA